MMYETWQTKEGRVIKIKDLTDIHLVNIIKMLKRKWDANYKYICNHHHDGITIASASDCLPEPDYDWAKPAQYDTLKFHAKIRGLYV